jgi:hypothetical protein
MRDTALAPVKSMKALNTFGGQAVVGLWVTRVQAQRLSTALRFGSRTMGENLYDFTQVSRLAYTPFPTTIYGITPLFPGRLSASSTGPIKSDSKMYKRIGVS